MEIKEGQKNPIAYLAYSSAQSWIVKEKVNPNQGGIYFKEGVDHKGPAPVVLLATIPRMATKQAETLGAILYFGDADFVNDQFLGMMANKDLFMNTAHWLEGELDLISTRPQQYAYPYHHLTKKQGQWIFWLLVVVLPLLPALIGSGIYIYRRWRG
ncbi:MAG: hypothetical protein WBN77_15420 [Desulfobacterales bacterium]